MKKAKNKASYFIFDFSRITGFPVLWFYYRAKIRYISKLAKKQKRKLKGSFLIVCNHTQYTDFLKLFLIFWYRRVHIFTLSKAFVTPLGWWWFKQMHSIDVKDYTIDYATFKGVKELVEHKKVIAIFPEGHIDGSLNDLKDGSAFIASHFDIPIVPLYCEKKTSFLKRMYVSIGEIINPKDVVKDAKDRAQIKALTKVIATKLKELKENTIKMRGK